jgi:hypothetical protein
MVLVFLALGLGLYADRGSLLPQPWGSLAELGTPWLALAFWAGRGSKSNVWVSGLLGASMIVLGLIAYYGWLWAVEGVAFGTLTHSYTAPSWFAVGLAIGWVFGGAGAASRAANSTVPKTAAWSLVAAVPLVEALRAVAWADVPWHGAVAVLLLLASLGTALFAVRASAVRPLTLLLTTSVLAFILVPAADVLREIP